MDVPPLPGEDPLARDTRVRLFELLGQLGRTATTDELASTLELHPNGIRRHLEQLQLAGLIRKDSVRQPRGRPKDGWSIDPDARPGGEPPRGYEELGRWLARAIPAGPDNLRQIEETGRAIGRDLPSSGAVGADADGGGLQDFERAVSWLGFAPHSDPPAAGERELTYRLTNCPYRQAVQENQPVICTLHKGILSGLLETLEPDAEITGFRPRDPVQAGCAVTLLLSRRAAAERRAHGSR
jgi:predicted ArsR family transcriptional regulator